MGAKKHLSTESGHKHVLKVAKAIRIDPGLKPSLTRVSGIAIDSRGCFYLSDEWNHRVVKLSPNGALVWSIGQKGNGEDAFHYPKGLALSEDEQQLLVCDSWNNRIVALDLDGGFKFQFGQVGRHAGQFYQPEDISVTATSDVIVADTGNHRLQRFSADGHFRGIVGRRGSLEEEQIALLYNTPPSLFTTPCFLFPTSTAPVGRDKVAVWDSGNKRVFVFDDLLGLKSEFTMTNVDPDGKLDVTSIAGNEIGFVFLFDNKRREVLQVAPPGFVVARLALVERGSDKAGLSTRMLATPESLVAIRSSSNEILIHELDGLPQRDALTRAFESTDRKEQAASALIAIAIEQRDVDLADQAITAAVSADAVALDGLIAATDVLREFDHPLNLYLLLSRAVHQAEVERESLEARQLELLRSLSEKIARSAEETAKCELALMAADEAPHSVREAEALREYQEQLLQLKMLMAQGKRQEYKLIDTVGNLALYYRKRQLAEAFDYCLSVMLRIAFSQADMLKETLIGARNRLGDMVGLSRNLMSEQPGQKETAQFVYLGRYRAVLDASKGLHLGLFARVVDRIVAALGEQPAASRALAKFLNRTDHIEDQFAGRVLNSAIEVFVMAAGDAALLEPASRLIWALLRSYPELREVRCPKNLSEPLESLGYYTDCRQVAPEELERFVYLHVLGEADSEAELLAASVFAEAAAVSGIKEGIKPLLQGLLSGSDGAAREAVLSALRSSREAIVIHAQSWARVLAESYARRLQLPKSPRAVANKALEILLRERYADCYGTILDAHRKSLWSCAQLCKLLGTGLVVSGDEGIASQVFDLFGSQRTLETVEGLAARICLPVTDPSGKPLTSEEALTNLGERNGVVHNISNTLGSIERLLARYRFFLSLHSVSCDEEILSIGPPTRFSPRAEELLVSLSQDYVNSQAAFHRVLNALWGKETIGMRDNVLDSKTLGEIVVTNVMLSRRAAAAGRFMEALEWAGNAREKRLGMPGKRAIGATDRGNSSLPQGEIELPEELLDATFQLYCSPSTRPAAARFWERMYAAAGGMWDDGGKTGLRKALNAALTRYSAKHANEAATPAPSHITLEELVNWLGVLSPYITRLLNARSGRLDEAGETAQALPFVDGAQDMIAQMHFTSFEEASNAAILHALSLGPDKAPVPDSVLETLSVGMGKALSELSSAKVPDNLCEWAQGCLNKVLSGHCGLYNHFKTIHNIRVASTEAEKIEFSRPPHFDPPAFDFEHGGLGGLSKLHIDNYRFLQQTATLAAAARKACLRSSSTEQPEPGLLPWIEATKSALSGFVQSMERLRQVGWSAQERAKVASAEATIFQLWPSIVKQTWSGQAVGLLSEEATAAGDLSRLLASVWTRVFLLGWSPETEPQQREGIFTQLDTMLKGDAASEDVQRFLVEVILREDADGEDVKRAVRLRSNYNVTPIETITPGLSHPYGIVKDDLGRLLIADLGNNRIVRYDHAADWLEEVAKPRVPGRIGPFVGPYSLAQWGEGYLCSFAHGQLVLAYSEQFQEMQKLGPRLRGKRIGTILGIAADQSRGRFYMADYDHNCVWSVTRSEGADGFDLTKSAAVETPLGIAVGPDGSIAVSSFTGHNVFLFNSDWDQTGLLEGFRSPHLLAFAPDGSLFVADTRNDCIKRFGPDGELVYSIRAKAPSGIWVDGQELIATGVETGEVWFWQISNIV